MAHQPIPRADLPNPSVVLTEAVLKAAELLDLQTRVLAAALGLSAPTISRMKNGKFILEQGTKPFELALVMVRVFRSLDAIVGGDAKSAQGWMRAENTILAARPIDKIQTILGIVDVLNYLDARRAPI